MSRSGGRQANHFGTLSDMMYQVHIRQTTLNLARVNEIVNFDAQTP